MRIRLSALALFLTFLWASAAHAQGTATWDTGYPKTGNNVGGILIKGSATPDAGWTVTTALCAVWPKNGGPMQSTNVSVNANGTIPEQEITGLTAGADYNLVIQVNVRSGEVTKTVATPPGVATAKQGGICCEEE